MNKVNMIYCDPIYNISYDYNRGMGKKNKYGADVQDTRSDKEYETFLKKAMENAIAVSEKDFHCFFWADQSYIWLIQKLYSDLGIKNRRVLHWVKNSFSPTPQCAFNKATESCIYGTMGDPFLSPQVKNLNEIMNKEVASGNRTIDDILDLIDIWLVKRQPTSEYQHSTSKPVTLHEKALRRCTKPNDIVLDLFGGGGSTLIACEQMKRRCYMAELEPRFCDVIIKRYEDLTGQKAKLISEGGQNESK